MSETIQQRKIDHLELCSREDVEYRLKTTLLDEVDLVHQALPELDVEEVDTSCRLLGRRLAIPFVVTGMTGGAPAARDINRALATVAQARGAAFGVGSQRAMLVDPGCVDTYAVRDVAPDVLLLGNIGAVQARDASTAAVQALVDAIEADALCVHLNPAQELIQETGDRDFRGVVAAIERLADGLDVPVVVKETGCGLSPHTVAALRGVGVEVFDVSGAGGTTWVGVEALRARPGRRALGEDFWEWGIPTAAAVASAVPLADAVIASGGIRTGLDAARALALGASAVGLALPLLRAYQSGGLTGVDEAIDRLAEGLRVAMVLTGSRDLAALRRAPRILGPRLSQWLAALSG